MRPLLLALTILFIAVSTNNDVGLARGHYGYHSYSHYRSSAPHTYRHGRSYRYSYRRIHRSLEVKHEFWDMTGHPHGWAGHVVDHITPLACGGADSPSNMQWQTIADAMAKDRVERRACRRRY
ncbi:MAG: HNH endonuclease [Candidatus Eremiobacteraeota bacterium]|nr:HNH endonuclease [Candidatus Eremiobacteraeota bacterium]